ncbi:GNAT family N-acetyltransferase [Phreatobacter sp.]|uniref:GNAT family N-acetyltransferase n=1 Tax=Phreatobacter sp. TaxID=1966341 RepID=UPI003F6F82C7
MARAPHPLGTIRALGRTDQTLHRDHLLRLDADGRRDRFNGVADDLFITRYSERCFAGPTRVFALVDASGAVRGTAELHPPLADEPADIAFSVEPHLRRRGIATALFEAVIAGARADGFGALRITSSAGNVAMRALARKFGARFTFEAGEATGLLPLAAPDAPVAREARRNEVLPAA